MQDIQLEVACLPQNIEDRALFMLVVQDFIDNLSPVNRVVLGLITAGYTQKEAASLLGLSRTSVGNTYRKIIQQLKDTILEE